MGLRFALEALVMSALLVNVVPLLTAVELGASAVGWARCSILPKHSAALSMIAGRNWCCSDHGHPHGSRLVGRTRICSQEPLALALFGSEEYGALLGRIRPSD
jgi:hypothetical protein